MSNLRKDKTCLNCGHTVEDIFCTHCGQKNIETDKNIFHVLGEFLGDYFHLDGKFFSSLVPLLFQPGKMTVEYNEGRRTKFIHPFRLYIFISIVFFFIYLSRGEKNIHFNNSDATNKSAFSIDSVLAKADSGEVISKEDKNNFNFSLPANLPTSLKAYEDSVNKLPADKKPNMISDFMTRRLAKGQEMGTEKFFEEWQRGFFHNIPAMMFFLLPLVALILKLLYIRRHRFFTGHLIFAVHLHSFIFLLLVLVNLILFTGINFPSINGWAALLILIYLFFSMKKVYAQKNFKTFLKLFIFLTLYVFAFALIFLFNLIYTTANI
jgi:hypothetical protein